MAAFSLSFSAVNLISQSKNQLSLYSTNSQGAGHTNVDPCYSGWRNKNCQKRTRTKPCGFRVFAATEGSAKSKESEETIPSWARPDSDEPPPWARGEGKVELKQGFNVPFYVYLLASAVTAIAATGSVFEYVNQRPVFGVLNSDSVFYAPVLGFFAFTGIPTSAFLWYKSVQVANKEAEEQDKRDGYR